MRVPQFNKGQRVYDKLDSYIYLTITGITCGDIDDEPVYEVAIHARNTGRFITCSVYRELNISATK